MTLATLALVALGLLLLAATVALILVTGDTLVLLRDLALARLNRLRTVVDDEGEYVRRSLRAVQEGVLITLSLNHRHETVEDALSLRTSQLNVSSTLIQVGPSLAQVTNGIAIVEVGGRHLRIYKN